jgi:hypothetical protein
MSVDLATRKERVTVPGTIRGEGYEARCTVRATRVTHPEGIDSALIDCSIEDESEPPPRDGTYEVTAGREIFRVLRRNGFWVAAP